MKAAPEFLLAKGLNATSRFLLITLLAAFGIALQFFVAVPLGWIPMFVAALFGALRGKSNEPDLQGRGEWENVTAEEIAEASKLFEKIGDARGRSCTGVLMSGGGCLVIAMALAGFLYLAFTLDSRSTNLSLAPIMMGGSLSVALVVDALILTLPIWAFGRIKAWEPPDLRMRLQQLWGIYGVASSDPVLEFQPSMLVAKTKDGSVPMDARLMVKIKDANPDFMGIQIQTTLNEVQGTKYPYTYCVLIAKPEFQLKQKTRSVVEVPPSGGFTVGFLGIFGGDANAKKEAKFARYQGAVVELNTENDVEIAVVRQGTSGTGYKTSEDQAYEIFRIAYNLAIGVLNVPPLIDHSSLR